MNDPPVSSFIFVTVQRPFIRNALHSSYFRNTRYNILQDIQKDPDRVKRRKHGNSVLDGTLTDRDSILVMFSPPSHRDNKLLMLQVMIYHASLPAYIKNPDHLIQLPMLRKQFR